MADALESGHASFLLERRKVRGAYPLTRIRTGRGGERAAWLLVKQAGDRVPRGGAPYPRRARPARTGRTLGQTARHWVSRSAVFGPPRPPPEASERAGRP